MEKWLLQVWGVFRRLAATPRLLDRPCFQMLALSNSFAFGGLNTELAFKQIE